MRINWSGGINKKAAWKQAALPLINQKSIDYEKVITSGIVWFFKKIWLFNPILNKYLDFG
jgi:hypothetical protein